VQDAADATHHAVSVVLPVSVASEPPGAENSTLRFCACELVVFVVLVKVMLPVETSETLPAAGMSSLPSVVAVQPVVVLVRVAAPVPRVAWAVADQ
jgi:hypothetical protein